MTLCNLITPNLNVHELIYALLESIYRIGDNACVGGCASSRSRRQ